MPESCSLLSVSSSSSSFSQSCRRHRLGHLGGTAGPARHRHGPSTDTDMALAQGEPPGNHSSRGHAAWGGWGGRLHGETSDGDTDGDAGQGDTGWGDIGWGCWMETLDGNVGWKDIGQRPWIEMDGDAGWGNVGWDFG